MILIVFLSIFAVFVPSISCDQKPEFLKNLNTTVIVHEGDPAQLECYASGSPEPEIRWERIEDTNQLNSLVIEKSINGNVWNLSTALKNDSGIYRCIADNGIGHPITLFFVLTVIFPAKLLHWIQYWPPNIVAEKITCIAEANPIGAITWYVDDKLIDRTNATLKIKHLNWSNITNVVESSFTYIGDYSAHEIKCVVTNELGKDEKNFN